MTQTPDGYGTVEEAAQLFGIHPRTVRKWIAAGKLEAVDSGRGYFVRLPRPAGDVEDAPSPDLPPVHQRPKSTAVAVPDIQPLADLVADLTRRNEELAAAAAMWQERARQLEEQVKTQALPQGEIAPPSARPWWKRIGGSTS